MAAGFCQAPSASQRAKPDTAFLSPDNYTNAFFGFSLPLPHERDLQILSMPAVAGYLFGMKATTVSSWSMKPHLTAFMVTAEPITNSGDGARAVALGRLKEQGFKEDAKSVQIGGRPFWRVDWDEKTTAGTLHSTRFVTATKSYALMFYISSFDGKLAGKLAHAVTSIVFFDPEKAREIAGPSSRPFSPSSGS